MQALFNANWATIYEHELLMTMSLRISVDMDLWCTLKCHVLLGFYGFRLWCLMLDAWRMMHAVNEFGASFQPRMLKSWTSEPAVECNVRTREHLQYAFHSGCLRSNATSKRNPSSTVSALGNFHCVITQCSWIHEQMATPFLFLVVDACVPWMSSQKHMQCNVEYSSIANCVKGLWWKHNTNLI